jgi:ABC-2 type transport system ATP-binding protein
MIHVNDVTFAYPRKKKPVLDHFSLQLEKGSIYGLLGKNGAGKSTLLYLIAGLLTAKSGKVEYNGINVRRRLPATLSEIFLVPEEFELPSVTLKKYVRLNSVFYPHFSEEDMMNNLKCFDMEMDAILNLNELSMGQKKKVFMSFALATHTSLLLMDEPTNGLDIPGKSQFRKFIAAGMNEGNTILISTHQVRDVDKLLDHIIIMDNSHVLLNRSTEEITRRMLFTESEGEDVAAEAIYSTPSLNGSYEVLPNKEERDSNLNIELLFNATLEAPAKIAGCFETSERKEDNHE